MTCLIGINSSQTFLPTLAVLKGKRLGDEVEQLENQNLVLTATTNAWINEESMLLWIERVWKPYSSQFERSLLIMDQFRVQDRHCIYSQGTDILITAL